MATWVNHIRIAQHFMEKYAAMNHTSFLVGNIGPDCGVPNKDHSAFDPDKNITHWKTQQANSVIDANAFKQRYLKEKDEKYQFYLGYYFHLLTDIEWGKFYHAKKLESIYSEGLQADPNFIWTIKNDWYGQDCVYLKEHPESIYFTQFVSIKEFPNIYLSFYPDNAFVRQIRYIKRYYMVMMQEKRPDEFKYLSREENDTFVDNTIKVLEETGLW